MPTEPLCPERESNPQTLGFKPSRSASLAYLGRSGPGRTRTADRHLVRVLPLPLGYRTALISVESPGVVPGSPACDAGVVLLDHDPNVSLQRKPWDSNPQAANVPPPAFQAGSSPIRMASVITPVKAEAVRLELTNGSQPSPVFKTGSSSGRMASVVVYQKLRRLESNQHEDVQSVSSYR